MITIPTGFTLAWCYLYPIAPRGKNKFNWAYPGKVIIQFELDLGLRLLIPKIAPTPVTLDYSQVEPFNPKLEALLAYCTDHYQGQSSWQYSFLLSHTDKGFPVIGGADLQSDKAWTYYNLLIDKFED